MVINDFDILCKMFFHWLFVFLTVKCVLISAEQLILGHCLKKTPNPGLMTCVGQQALSSLHFIEEQTNYTIANGLVMVKDETLSSRTLPNIIDQDPVDFRGILENAGAVIGRRSLQWDLSIIQPGLCMRIGPTSDTNSVLEFVMDPSRDRGDGYIEEQSTGRILSRHFILPFLLGLKFNLATILPLLFAGIILLCKKAALLGKFALFITGLLGFGGLFSLGSLGGGFGQGGFGHGGHGGFFGGHRPFFTDVNVATASGGGIGNGPIPLHDHLSGGYFKADDKNKPYQNPNAGQQALTNDQLVDSFYDYEKKVLLQDRKSKLFDKDAGNSNDRPPSDGYRTFAWTTITS